MGDITTIDSMMPTTFKEWEIYATKISQSSFCPPVFKGKPGDVLIALQMGWELGLKPLQAIQGIAVINGKPSLYGDAFLAVVKGHPQFEWMKEEVENDIATCIIKRKGEPEHISKFSVEDAKRAGLWGKSGPWTNYPSRMLQMRARGFCCRDTFPDALKGFITSEEAQDYATEKYINKVEKQTPINNPIIGKLDDKPLFEDENKDKLVDILNDLILKTNFSEEKQLKWCNAAKVEKFGDMTSEQLLKCIKRLEEMIKDKEESQDCVNIEEVKKLME